MTSHCMASRARVSRVLASRMAETGQMDLLVRENRRGDERVVTQCYAGEFSDNMQARTEFQYAIEHQK